MDPFDRLNGRAKHTLALAEHEAERAGHSYVGTEHLLLGLLTEAGGPAWRVLVAMGVETHVVRERIASVLGREELIPVQRRLPTSRVKRVIEIAFEEAQSVGDQYVGTEHLLLGLLVEGQGIAAHVLTELGVTLEEVRLRIARELKRTGEQMARQVMRRFPPFGGPGRVPMSVELVALLEEAQTMAEKEGSEMIRADHLLSALLRRQSPVPGLVSLLAASGADLDLARRRLHVPAAVPHLQAELAEARQERVEAAAVGDEERASAASELVADRSRHLAEVLEAWQATWGEAP